MPRSHPVVGFQVTSLHSMRVVVLMTASRLFRRQPELAARSASTRLDPVVETIALADGDPRWVFPKLDDPSRVLEALRAGDARLRRLAADLGVTPSWTGSGLEFHRFPNGVTDLFGSAETSQVSFIAELNSGILGPQFRTAGGPPWEVSAEISVRCDARRDCGMHLIEERPPSRHHSPLEAAAELAAAGQWLLDRGTAEQPSSWGDRDRLSGHS
jgi:hypothetical protein